MFYCERKAQYKQIGPVPPLAPVPPRRPSTTIVALAHHVKNKWLEGFLHVWGGNSCFTAKGSPVQANRQSATISPSATKKIQCHHGGTWPPWAKQVIGRFLTCLKWKFMFYCERRAQYKKKGPVPPLAPVPPRRSSVTIRGIQRDHFSI